MAKSELHNRALSAPHWEQLRVHPEIHVVENAGGMWLLDPRRARGVQLDVVAADMLRWLTTVPRSRGPLDAVSVEELARFRASLLRDRLLVPYPRWAEPSVKTYPLATSLATVEITRRLVARPPT